MSLLQLILIMCAYLFVLMVVIYFTKPTLSRIGGALAGGAAGSCLALIVFVLGDVCGFWRGSLPSRTGLLMLFYVTAISFAPIYLCTWRFARRFGRHGLIMFVGGVALIGPPRDYLFAAKYPEWLVFAPGVAPILTDAAAYVGIVVLGHAVMRLVAGPQREDRLAKRS